MVGKWFFYVQSIMLASFCYGASSSMQASSSIIETHDIKSLQYSVDQLITQGIAPHEIAIACDMDETLVTTYLEIDGKVIEFPQSRFFEFLKKELKQRNKQAGIVCTDADRFSKANDIVTFLQTHNILKTKSMQIETLPLIKALQEKQINVFILTARPSFAADRTKKTLHMLEIHLRPGFLKTPETMIDASIGCCCIDGVLYAQKGKIDKGEAMARLFAMHAYKPRVLLAIDDRLEYLEGIKQALTNWNSVHYQGLWYRRAESWHIDEATANAVLEKHLSKCWWQVS